MDHGDKCATAENLRRLSHASSVVSNLHVSADSLPHKSQIQSSVSDARKDLDSSSSMTPKINRVTSKLDSKASSHKSNVLETYRQEQTRLEFIILERQQPQNMSENNHKIVSQAPKTAMPIIQATNI